MSLSLNSGAEELLPYHRGRLLVRVLRRVGLRSHVDAPPIPAGSSSQPSTTSSVSSEGVALIGGRYGSVLAAYIRAFPAHWHTTALD